MPAPTTPSRPERTCVGCRTRRPAGSLVRCALGADGSALICRTAPGRGAWICTSIDCFDRAARRAGFDRAWRTKVSPDTLAQLREAVVAALADMTHLQSAAARPGGADGKTE